MKILSNINYISISVATLTAFIVVFWWVFFPHKKELKTFKEDKEIEIKNIDPKIKTYATENDNIIR
jgi:hypothetical protein